MYKSSIVMELFFDVETTGLPARGASCFDLQAYSNARIVSIAWVLRSKYEVFSQRYSIIKQDDKVLDSEPLGASYIHGISRGMSRQFGKELLPVLKDFVADVALSDTVVAHNLEFDSGVVASEMYRLGLDPSALLNHKSHCTMKSNTSLVKKTFKSSNPKSTNYKWPKLSELHHFCFHVDMKNAHNALADVENTAKCYYFVRDNVVDLTGTELAELTELTENP